MTDATASSPDMPAVPSRLRSAAGMAGVSLACLVIGLASFVVVFSLSWVDIGDPFPEPYNWMLFVDLVLGPIAAIAIGPMRRAGMWNLVLVALFFWSSAAAAAVVVALARVGERRDLRWDAVALAVTIAAGLGSGRIYSVTTDTAAVPWVDLAFSVAMAVAALLWGRVRATRAALVTSLRTQVSTAQREREAGERAREALALQHEALVSQAEAEQRAEIARDMHDSLSHHLSLIAMHAGALAYREDMAPERMREVAGTIRDNARAANTELREVLTTLRSDGAPLPTGADLQRLVTTAREAGHDVRLEWADGLAPADLDQMSPTSVVALVRITRELITNARKHSPGAPITLRIGHSDEDGRSDEGITLRAANPVPGTSPPSGIGTGTGLIGARERVRLLGGTLDVHDPGREDGGDAPGPDGAQFTVEVFLPWRS